MSGDNYNISINVKTQFIEEQSDTDKNRYVFSYTITILNKGSVSAQLLSRHWVITDSNQKVQDVKGEGVVGEKPYLQPGNTFNYTSGTVLETPFGTMRGSYQMVADDGTQFEAEVEEFILTAPRTLH